jgi:rod shape-determining protein MreD
MGWAAVIITALLLQSTIFSQIKLGGAKPELMYVVTVALALLEGPATGALTGFAAGMAQDFLLHQPKGLTALTLTLLGYVVGMLRQYILSPSPLMPVILVAASTAGGVLFYGFVSFLLGELREGLAFLVRTAALSALYNAVLTPLFFPLLRRVAEASRSKKVYRW